AVADVCDGPGAGPLSCSHTITEDRRQAAHSAATFIWLRSFATGTPDNMLTAAITNEIPNTPVHGAILVRVKLSICEYPSRSHGNPVTRSRANSTATHSTGEAIKAVVRPQWSFTTPKSNPKRPR